MRRPHRFFRKEGLLRAQVEDLKWSLHDKFALVASQALEAIHLGKLQEAGFSEWVRGAALAAGRAGIRQLAAVDQLVDALSTFPKKAASSDAPTVTVDTLAVAEAAENTSLN